METPQCLALGTTKVGDGIQVKQENDTDLEITEFDMAGSVEDAFIEPTMASGDELLDAALSFSEEDSLKCDRGMNMVQRRRLRFCEADDMLLLRQVALHNPYRCTALWKDITQTVGNRSGKKFSIRTMREHTDLLMNSFSLRGPEACLKRTPPAHWARKKQLLQTVFEMWKRDVVPSRTSTLDMTKKCKGSKQSSPEERHSQQRLSSRPDSPSSTPTISQGTALCPVTSLSSSSESVHRVAHPQSVPLTLHFRAPAQTIACSPLLASSLQAPHLAVNLQAGLQKLATSSVFQPSSTEKALVTQGKLLSAQASSTALNLIVNTVRSKPPLLTPQSSVPSEDVSELLTADRSTSPIPFSKDCSTVKLDDSDDALRNPPSNTPVDSSTSCASPKLHSPEEHSTLHLPKRRQGVGSLTRARAEFLRQRHRDQFTLRRRELALEEKRLCLEERRLSLEERKVQLEEEKWLFEKEQREEKLLLMSEERDHKMAMERRQQNMLDILLELKKKE